MRNRKADIPTIGVENIAAYVNGKRDLANRHFAIMPDGSQFYILNGRYIPAEMMEDTIPSLRKKAVYKGNSLDGRTNWIE